MESTEGHLGDAAQRVVAQDSGRHKQNNYRKDFYFHSGVSLWERIGSELRSVCTHSVVSWLMLVKDELVRVLILLLLKSLKSNTSSI